MATVSKNHWFKWFAVMVFTLSRLKTNGSEETRFAAVRFTVPGKVCGLITVRFYNSRLLSLRVGFGPVCTQQHLSSRTATPSMPSTLGMYSPLRANFFIVRHPPSPQESPLVPITHPGSIGFVFLAAQQ